MKYLFKPSRRDHSETLIIAGIIIVMMLLMCVVGTMDYEDEVNVHLFACERIRAGEWPEFHSVTLEECNIELSGDAQL